MSDDYDPLEQDQMDALAASGRAVASMIPMFGGIVGEIISQRLPAQRTDRIVQYIRDLNERVEALEGNWRNILADPERIDLIEEGGFQAARATNAERIKRIVELVAQGVASEETDIVRRKRLAGLLGQIDDDEIMMLNAYGQWQGGQRGAFECIPRPDRAHIGAAREVIEAEKLYQLGRENLLRLGLLAKKYEATRKGEERKFDAKKGDFEHHVEISYLGRMLLRSVGQPSPLDNDVATESGEG